MQHLITPLVILLLFLPLTQQSIHSRLSGNSAPPSENLLTKDSFSSLQASLKGDQVLTYKSECNVQWSYYFQGTDWNCLCSTGTQQSPVNLCSQGA